MATKQPQLNFVFDRRHTATLNKKSSVELRITYNYKQKYINTGIKLYINQWRNKVVNCPDATQLNQTLDKLLLDVRQILLDDIDIINVQEELNKRNQKEITFIEFCEQRATIRKYGKSVDSQERYDRFIRLFKQWGKIQTFEDVSEANIIMYDTYLTSTGMKPYSKWNNYHRFLNSFILDSIDAGFIRKNPYKWININKCKESNGLNRCLTPNEFNKLENLILPNKHLERVRDLFIFQTYTCLSYSDTRNFDSTKIQTIKNMAVYIGKRKKTNITFTIPLLPIVIAILKKYNNKLPIISNVKYNAYLKELSNLLGINKPISTHWARHTGATLLLNKGVDIRIVSKICGHSSTRITEQVYAKLLDETVVNAIQEIKKKLE